MMNSRGCSERMILRVSDYHDVIPFDFVLINRHDELYLCIHKLFHFYFLRRYLNTGKYSQ